MNPHTDNESSGMSEDAVVENIVVQPVVFSNEISDNDKKQKCNRHSDKTMKLVETSTSKPLPVWQEQDMCDLCQAIFTKPANLAYHYQQHIKSMRQQIQDCSIKAKALYAQLKIGTGLDAVYQCDKCSLNFKYLTKLAIHYGKHYEKSAKLSESETLDESNIKSSEQYTHVKVGTGKNVVYKCKQEFKVANKLFNDYGTHLQQSSLNLPENERHVESNIKPSEHLNVGIQEKIVYKCVASKLALNNSKHLEQPSNLAEIACSDKSRQSVIKLNELYAHLNIGTGKKVVYKCDKCEREFKLVRTFAHHYKRHTILPTNLAEIASLNKNMQTKKLKELYAHLNVATGKEAVYKCDKCEQEFKLVKKFARHYDKHVGMNNVKKNCCEQCGRAFSAPSQLKQHYIIHTGDRPYPCGQCGRTFSTKHNLITHIRQHTGERPYICKQCNKSFAHKGHWKNHINAHGGQKPFQCQHCGKTFGYRTGLKSHLRRHNNERTHKCDLCSLAFFEHSRLVVHRRTHTGEKPYVCQFCGKGFIDSKHLTLHIRTHTGEKPYHCNICPDKAFGQNLQLKLHMRTHHKHLLKNNMS